MMTSFVENIPAIVKYAVSLRPRAILDIGAGFGKFALLIREALLSIRAETGELIPKQYFWIDCVESCRYFVDLPWHDRLYEKHYHGDIFTLDRTFFSTYDLIMMIDVVEHEEKGKMLELIRDIRRRGEAVILISTPRAVVFYKEHYYGPDCPVHKSQWSESDFKEFKAIDRIASKDSLIVGIR